MGFKCGLVGLPNVGKSTLFNALTSAGAPAENYPFCTIEPHVGIVPVPDERLARIAAIAQSAKIVPARLEFVDIAGLVDGASRGEGLGNQFLDHIRRVHAVAHVVRCFDDDEVSHVAARVDPKSDLETIRTELMLADLQTVERALDKASRAAKAGDKAQLFRRGCLERAAACLGDGRELRALECDDDERALMIELGLITFKPALAVANTAEGARDNPHVRSLAAHADALGLETVVVCASFETEVAELDAAERAEFLADAGYDRSGLERMTDAGYRLLDLLTFFTAGPQEARAWTTKRRSTAPAAAGRIHSDFERGFICAETVAYDDYIACGGEQGAREAGKLRQEGKDYIVCEGDVMHFRFNV